MTESQIALAFVQACDNILSRRKIIPELIQEPKFQSWVKEITKEGISPDDEYFAYKGETELDKTIGPRLSYLEYASTKEDQYVQLQHEAFRTVAQSVIIGNQKYWIITMIGQGATSWLCTDDYFKQNYKVAQ